ncbi:hypothetical protein SELMODRAFT_170984 [Selaginella moellendorffii]|uniref:Association with the SNF1 complex (ASC) domain-containing protein n=1 Tax=Selaginella moellendorffii TaxID=88036 RepID=D8RFC1_SELML|nr:SNF1-related protein kinase regulatory subunit beta-2 [Selaginella moellendorffii]EFJ29089.1 hypothetical protein SELMODRAFT_170984 [Selaginella moellendorffii]|eukprot:XP_002969965.1 SNF1-related protein kinase regulatory subunit beta-2 [Selaginella moellendorffii]
MGNANATGGGEPMQSSQPRISEQEGKLGHAGGSSEYLSDSPGESVRCPLMFAPQAPMAPISKPDGIGVYEPNLYKEHGGEKGIPCMIVWSLGGNNVSIEGSWDNWSTRQPLQRSGKDFSILKLLPAGVYQFKFFVDGEWRHAPDLSCSKDEAGNVSNLIEVQEYVPENLDNVVSFEPPLSPDSSYTNPFPGPEDFAKEPPAVPPHLHLTLLNVPASSGDAPASMPRPQHVILNHLYVEKGRSSRSVLALGATHRFRSKYVTVVVYRPLRK